MVSAVKDVLLSSPWVAPLGLLSLSLTQCNVLLCFFSAKLSFITSSVLHPHYIHHHTVYCTGSTLTCSHPQIVHNIYKRTLQRWNGSHSLCNPAGSLNQACLFTLALLYHKTKVFIPWHFETWSRKRIMVICMGRYDCPVDLFLLHGYNFEYEVLLVVLFSFHFGPAIYTNALQCYG